jgi:hypothetical protein
MLEILLVQRYHCVDSVGTGEPLHTRELFIVSVEPTEAVPVIVKVPLLKVGTMPTAAVASE